jgi:NitT/TauT family transport system substrate-binding protein
MTRRFGVFAIAVAFFASVGAATPAAAQGTTPLKIIFSAPPTTFQLPHHVAKDEKWFDRAGLRVEESYVAGDSNAVRGLVSGGADVASTGLMVALQAIAEGAKIKVIGAWQPRVDYQVLVQDRIKTFKDLSGSRIATASAGGLTQRIPEMLMQKHAVEIGKTSFISLGGHEARMKAVITDKVDASVVGMLYAATAMREGRGVHVLSSIADDFPAIGFTYAIAMEKDLSDPVKRQAIEKYVRWGILEGSRFILKNPDRAAEIMQSRSQETPIEVTKAVIKDMNKLGIWGDNGGLDQTIIDFTNKMGVEMGAMRRPLAAGEGIDRSLVDKALSESGR